MMNGYTMTGWAWFWMTLVMAGTIAVIVVLVVTLSRRTDDGRARAGGPTPETLLRTRFARGEIDEEEYRRRLDVLRGGRRADEGLSA